MTTGGVLKRRWLLAPLILALTILSAVTYPLWLSFLASSLVCSEPPEKADAILVLAGDALGNRILKATELASQGLSHQILVSSPPAYGSHEGEFAIEFAVQHGYPAKLFVELPHEASSTREEAHELAPVLRKLGVKKVLLITSNYHTCRAARVFRQAAPEIQFIVVAAPDPSFSPDRWWQTREGRKTFLVEWLKTVAYWFGI